MKFFLFALGLIASVSANRCYQCYGDTDPNGKYDPDCFDESNLQKEEYQCTRGECLSVSSADVGKSGPVSVYCPDSICLDFVCCTDSVRFSKKAAHCLSVRLDTDETELPGLLLSWSADT